MYLFDREIIWLFAVVGFSVVVWMVLMICSSTDTDVLVEVAPLSGLFHFRLSENRKRKLN